MNICFLGSGGTGGEVSQTNEYIGETNNPLVKFLETNGEDNIKDKDKDKDNTKKNKVFVLTDKITVEYCQINKIEFVISYNYTHIIPEDVILLFPNKIINLHISYLPYNRGAHPNIWSFIDNTKKGVTIHKVDKTLDTGDILLQKIVNFDDTIETLETTYNKLHLEIQELFKKNWNNIRDNKIKATPQPLHISTYHNKKQLNLLKLDNGWNTTIKQLLADNAEYIQRKTNKTKTINQ